MFITSSDKKSVSGLFENTNSLTKNAKNTNGIYFFKPIIVSVQVTGFGFKQI
jgi:hypothetical protein